jgi:hypothetical protein
MDMSKTTNRTTIHGNIFELTLLTLYLQYFRIDIVIIYVYIYIHTGYLGTDNIYIYNDILRKYLGYASWGRSI